MYELHDAAEQGDFDAVKRILATHPHAVNEKSDLGDTALHDASLNNQVAVAKLLVKYGADVNRKGNKGKTPLHYAAEGGAIDVVKFLVKQGARLEESDDRGQTPLMTAVNHTELGAPKPKRWLIG